MGSLEEKLEGAGDTPEAGRQVLVGQEGRGCHHTASRGPTPPGVPLCVCSFSFRGAPVRATLLCVFSAWAALWLCFGSWASSVGSSRAAASCWWPVPALSLRGAAVCQMPRSLLRTLPGLLVSFCPCWDPCFCGALWPPALLHWGASWGLCPSTCLSFLRDRRLLCSFCVCFLFYALCENLCEGPGGAHACGQHKATLAAVGFAE